MHFEISPAKYWPFPFGHCLHRMKCSCGKLLKTRIGVRGDCASNNERDGFSNHRRLTVCLTVCWAADQRKHQSSASLSFVRGIQRSPVDSHQKGPITRKMFPIGYVFMRENVQQYERQFISMTSGTRPCQRTSVLINYWRYHQLIDSENLRDVI